MPPTQQVLHLIDHLDGYGLSRQLELLVSQQVSAGHAVRAVALSADQDPVAELRRLGVDCRVLERRWQRDPFAAIRLARELRRQSHDVLHVWGQTAASYLSSLRRWVDLTPTIVSLPNRILLNFRQDKDISPGIGLPNSKSPSRQEFLAEQLLSEDAILIAVAGPLNRAQRIDEAIWYFELVRTLEARVRLLIFGDGPDRHRLERFSRLTSDPSAIRFLGYRSDFRVLLPHADLFWHTAVADEALPLTVLEAMAARVPVIANDGPGCRKIVDDGANGYLAPDKDRAVFTRYTRKLLQNAEHADQLSANAAETVDERFSVAAMTDAYANLYDELSKN